MLLLCLLCEGSILLAFGAEVSVFTLVLIVLVTVIATFAVALYNFSPLFDVISELMNNPLKDKEITQRDVAAGFIKRMNTHQKNISTAIKNVAMDVQLRLFLDLIRKRPLTEEYVETALNSTSCRFGMKGLFAVYAFLCSSSDSQLDLERRILFEADFFDIATIELLPDDRHIALVLEFIDEHLTENEALRRMTNIEKTIFKGLCQEFDGIRVAKGPLFYSLMDAGFAYEEAVAILSNSADANGFDLSEKQISQMIQWYVESSYAEGDGLKERIVGSVRDKSEALRVLDSITYAIREYEFIERDAMPNEYARINLLPDSVDIRQELRKSVTDILEEIKKQADKLNNPAIIKARRIIAENYMDSNLSQTDVAERLGISPTYFSRLFSATMGISYIKYINRYRVNISLDLLRNTDMTLEEISAKCGFSSARNYTYAFKNEYEVTPNIWRKNRIVKN